MLESANSIQDQEQTKQNPQYQAFKEAGGSLTEIDYQKTTGKLRKMAKFPHIENRLIKKANKATTDQFDHQAEICRELKIATSPKQKALYCYLRRRRGNDSAPQSLRAHGLTDQEIMADIILMTGTVTDYNKYLAYYPTITKRRFPATKTE